ncbi:MAG: hypothetical protein JO181_09145 [Solirubrobacterales bacterium]|nr:hypothetical protein [Solirubrobacterales bacterium]
MTKAHARPVHAPVRVPASTTAGTQAAISIVLARAKELLLPAARVLDSSPGHRDGLWLLFGALALVALVFASLGLLRLIRRFDDEWYRGRAG